MGGIAGNWLWWSWAIAHVVATFIFARMWRRSGVITDAEITELRYAGKAAALLRGTKAIYFGVFINCLTMAWVIAAMAKIGKAFFDAPQAAVITGCLVLSVVYTTLGGFRSVVLTDLVQFTLGMAGAVVLAILVVVDFHGMGSVTSEAGLLGTLNEAVAQAGQSLGHVLDFVPDADHPTVPPALFVTFLLAGWWRYAEGNGYTVQRLAACKSEGHAQGASLWFAVAHNALRPWPWIVVALASLVLFPQLPGEAPESLSAGGITVTPATVDVTQGGTLTLTGVSVTAQSASGLVAADVIVAGRKLPGEAVAPNTIRVEVPPLATTQVLTLRVSGPRVDMEIPGLRAELTDRELAYPLLMVRYLPPGLMGLVVASLLAAFMSTIDTHTNWGASYLVRDVYQRFIRPDATEKHLVWVSRGCIALMAVLAGATALFIESIADVWRFIVTLGAGLGSVAALRWLWHRVTAHAELAALAVTTALAVVFQAFFTPTLFGNPNPWVVAELSGWSQILIIAAASLLTWVPVAVLGPQNDRAQLQRFATLVKPPGPGWAGLGPAGDPLWPALLKTVGGIAVVYGALFGMGYLILGPAWKGAALLAGAAGLLAWIIYAGRGD
jgi:Na+/proline symporter